MSGAGLAGAIIRFFEMVWPNPPKIQVRAWVERTPGQVSIDGPTRTPEVQFLGDGLRTRFR